MNEPTFVVRLHWYRVEEAEDLRWNHNLALYAYLAPRKAEVYYIGKCDGTTVRGRGCYSAKSGAWDFINKTSQHHRLIVSEIEVDQRLTRELLADIECLLIYRVQPECNVQCKSSRGKYSRPGMKIECRGAWPLSKKVFRDD